MSGSEGGISKPTVARQKGGLYLPYQSIDFAVHTIRPWLIRIEQAMNRALFSEKEKGRFYVQFNLDGLMRGDYKSRMEGYAIARQNGWMSANDIRALENMNPISEEEGGNAYLVNGNMIPISFCGLGPLLSAVAAAAGEGEETAGERPPEKTEDKPKKSPQKRRKKEEQQNG